MLIDDRPTQQKAHFRRFLGGQFDWPVIIFVIYLGVIYVLQPAFFSTSNLSSVLYSTCLLVPAILTVHLLMVLGLFDLSIGAVAAIGGVIAAKALISGCSLIISISLAMLVGLIFGLLNWLLITKARISALIGTLITLGMARAAALAITDGQIITGLPNEFGNLVIITTNSISPVITIGLAMVLMLEILERQHVLFRRFYHIGSNRIAAVNGGINVVKLECLGFILAGVGASATGVLQCARTMSASPLLFPDLALECIAASVIGGSSLKGGAGTAIGAFLGMLVVVVSRNLAVLVGVSVYWRDLAIALVLLAAVLLNKNTNDAQ